MKRERIYPKESWLLVMAALVLNLSFGMTNSFGLFFSTIIRESGWPMGLTAVAYSIYTMVYGLSTIVAGWLSDRYSVNKVVAAGATITALGFALASVASQVWHLYVTFGVMVGIGLGTFWVPPVLVVSKSFDKSPNLRAAVAIVTTGTGFGTILMPPISALFIENFGRGTAFLLVGMLIAFIAAPSIMVMKPKTCEIQAATETPRGYQASAIFRNSAYWLIFLGNLISALGQTAIMVHLPSFAVDEGISLTLASVAIGLTGVGTILGRLLLGGPMGKVDVHKLLSYVLLLQAISLGLLIKIDSVLLLYVFSLAWGVLWGARVFAIPMLLRNYFGLLAFGAAYGVINAGFGVGGLFGPTIVGYLHDATGSYFFGFLFTSVILLAGSLVTFLVVRVPAKDPRSS